MRLESPLAVITPTVDGEVLSVLARTSKPLTVGEVHRLLGKYSHAGVRKVLLRLAKEGIAMDARVGNVITYEFNGEHLAAPAIRALAALRETFFKKLRDDFESWETAPVFAAIFGSAARAEMETSSDVDIFVVQPDALGPADMARWEASRLILERDATRWIGNDVRMFEIARAEVVQNLRTDPILESVRTDGIALFGSSATFWRKIDAENGRLHPGGTSRAASESGAVSPGS